MKNWITIILVCFLGSNNGFTQSQTFEVAPSFEMHATGYISEVIEFSPSFEALSFVGISCYHFDDEENLIEYRIEQEGVWSAWEEFTPQHEMVAENRKAYEGKFLLVEFSSVQLRTMHLVHGPLSVRFFLGQKQKSSATEIQKSVSCDMLEVCDRTCWCPTCTIDPTPQLTIPTHIIIHHSAGSNQPSIVYASVVEYIWDLHVNTNGWDDIGYNWLIDPNGVLYEGRPDGYQGAHFSCINENTIGVCLLGDFTLISPTELCLATLINLIAFETTDHQIDVVGESFHETGEFILSNIAGHKDSSGSDNACSATACPGDTFYPMLDSIRVAVSGLDCYQESVSTTKVEEVNNLVFFPNPFQDRLSVYSSSSAVTQIDLIDINGHHFGKYSTENVIELGHLPEGIYFVILDRKVVEKLLKKD